MTRGFGGLVGLQEAIPVWLAVVLALLTQLGDAWFLAILLGMLYWKIPERREGIATVAGLWVAGIGLTQSLKHHFGVPRPDRPLLDPEALSAVVWSIYELTGLATGYGFPSGHAVSATVVYLGLALVLPYSTGRRRGIGAGLVVAIVCITRVALGVHFVVDVVVGVLLGIGLLLGGWVLSRRLGPDRPTVAFGIAVVSALMFLLVSRGHPHGFLTLTAAIGPLVAWRVVGSDGS